MTSRIFGNSLCLLACIAATVVALRTMAGDFAPADFFSGFAGSPHLEVIGQSDTAVSDHEVGLGTLKKVRGSWEFSDSERVSGQLVTRTWRVLDGFTSLEVLEEFEQELEGTYGARELFACDGRACGSAAQWASRVFRERLLYGRADLQRYRVYAIGADVGGETRGETGREAMSHMVVLYAASRTADRQYLHMETLAPAE